MKNELRREREMIGVWIGGGWKVGGGVVDGTAV